MGDGFVSYKKSPDGFFDFYLDTVKSTEKAFLSRKKSNSSHFKRRFRPCLRCLKFFLMDANPVLSRLGC